jgi:uncharacterized DUF497 family protein
MEDLQFAWDTHNRGHLGRHNVRPEEAEQALRGDILDLDYKVTEEGEPRWTAIGRTIGGRILVIVWTVLRDGRYRPFRHFRRQRVLNRSITECSMGRRPETLVNAYD